MQGWKPETYGDRAAASYDRRWPRWGDEEGCVAFLARAARGGRVLELGVGTGRIAIPLAARGLEVHGLDTSRAMLAKLRRKRGGRAVRAAAGDMRDIAAEGPFRLVYVVFNTFFSLTTQEDQVACFRSVAARLSPNGVFVVEAFVPDVARFDRGQRTSVARLALDEVDLDAAVHDPVAQTIATQHVLIRRGRISTQPVFCRYAWPPELDLMARLAGLELRSRHGGWRGEPFSASSGSHVSIYGRTA